MQIWKPGDYDSKLGFISGYGKDVIDLLDPKPGERILDVGCGTGDLAFDIAGRGAEVTGVDYSDSMVAHARSKYPSLDFQVGNAEVTLPTGPFDAVFSNAALHWMKEANGTVRNIFAALRPGGRFIAEFGGAGNISAIAEATTRILTTHYSIDARARNPWYFPTIGEYSSLLEAAGFEVRYAIHFDRPTPLSNGDDGLAHWLESFAGMFFTGLSSTQKADACQAIAQSLKDRLFLDSSWFADYRRIRVAAVRRA